MTDTEFGEMFESDGEVSRVRSWIREGISWPLGDVGDPGLAGVIGRQDMVVASNFLCHMEAAEAENCLRNMARLERDEVRLIRFGIPKSGRL